jgi:site-specific recombinase XerD
MNQLTTTKPTVPAALTPEAFYALRDVPPEAEWFANIDNPNTRRAYRHDIRDFMAFNGLTGTAQLREVNRIHVIAWRTHLVERSLSDATIRRKLSAVSSLYAFLAENNSVLISPVDGVKRPKVDSLEGKTPALADQEARDLLAAPDQTTLKGKRDYAILSVMLYHALRRDEVCKLRVKDLQDRRGVKHLLVQGKGNKLRYIPIHPDTMEAIHDYLNLVGHGDDREGALFRPTRNNRTGHIDKALSTDAIWRIVREYAMKAGIPLSDRLAPHALRATAATNALENEADIAKVQQFLGHANISTTRIYDRRDMRPADSPVWRIKY